MEHIDSLLSNITSVEPAPELWDKTYARILHKQENPQANQPRPHWYTAAAIFIFLLLAANCLILIKPNTSKQEAAPICITSNSLYNE
jgi:hypothetical protein